MTPRVRQYAAEEAMRAGVLVSDVLRKRGEGESARLRPHPAKAARRAMMCRLRADGFSLKQIGGWLGIDHTTVIYWTSPERKGPRSEDSEARPAT